MIQLDFRSSQPIYEQIIKQYKYLILQGYLKKGDMHNIVTSGVGLFGPNMRVGTKAEICPITVHFAGSTAERS